MSAETGEHRVRWLVGGSSYVVAVGALAVVGFATSKTWAILLAGLAALPSSLWAVPAFYVGYGMLTLVPGATTSQSSGSGSCTAAGVCHESSTGDPGQWLNVADGVLGVLALVGAAVLNVMALRLIIAVRRRHRGTPAPPRPVQPAVERS